MKISPIICVLSMGTTLLATTCYAGGTKPFAGVVLVAPASSTSTPTLVQQLQANLAYQLQEAIDEPTQTYHKYAAQRLQKQLNAALAAAAAGHPGNPILTENGQVAPLNPFVAPPKPIVATSPNIAITKTPSVAVTSSSNTTIKTAPVSNAVASVAGDDGVLSSNPDTGIASSNPDSGGTAPSTGSANANSTASSQTATASGAAPSNPDTGTPSANPDTGVASSNPDGGGTANGGG
jgi:hypothetical protein